MSNDHETFGLCKALQYCLDAFERHGIDFFSTSLSNEDIILSKLPMLYANRSTIEIIEDSIYEANHVQERREQLLGKFWSDLHHIDDNNQDSKDAQSSVDNDTPVINIARIRNKPAKYFNTNEHDSLVNDIDDSTVIHNSYHSSITTKTSFEFKREHVHANIPCLICGLGDFHDGENQGMDQKMITHQCQKFSPLFNYLTRKPPSNNSSISNVDPNSKHEVNIEWFQRHIDRDIIVPVKFQQQPSDHTAEQRTIYTNDHHDSLHNKSHQEHDSIMEEEEDTYLDQDYRAVECKTVTMKLQSWIDKISVVRDKPGSGPIGYLKDWHLQGLLQDKWKINMDGNDDTHVSNNINDALCPRPLLYEVPDIFTRDLLNHFLLSYLSPSPLTEFDNLSSQSSLDPTTFKDSKDNVVGDETTFTGRDAQSGNATNDFRFVYWGPDQSFTGLHSDVLNTFSWSFNIVGKKRWTFYPPQPLASASAVSSDHDHNVEKEQSVREENRAQSSFQVIQYPGETIFVPSGWKHEVTNIGETLSVNHNWITASILDRVWDCILAEINSIHNEMKSWMDADCITMDSFSTREKNEKSHPSSNTAWDYGILENMLRGCLSGLNVSSFVMMVATAMVETMESLGLLCVLGTKTACVKNDMNSIDEQEVWLKWFDLACMANVLKSVLESDSNNVAESGSTTESGGCNLSSNSTCQIQLKLRLKATLQSENLDHQAIEILSYLSKLFQSKE